MSQEALPQTVLRAPAPGPSPTGLFITFEGGDSAGKSTQIRLLREHLLQRRGRSPEAVLTTREPGGTELGVELRRLVMHGDHVAPRAEALLYAADRAHHIETLVRPHLAAGGVVLGDRYLDSSIAYQGAGRALDPAQVGALSLWATDGLLPHRTLLLDIDPSVIARRRSAGSLDRLERAGSAFHEAVREQFLALAAADPQRWRVIDGAGTREQVHAQILAALEADLDALAGTVESPADPAAAAGARA
ncbi:dTMP kinase [Brachybacterium nesterenkovii]|uniref:dTMP kinase n=1 Tax=Brachybacterium nesterenkovii TaxID=47847 RepID=UPI003218FA61